MCNANACLQLRVVSSQRNARNVRKANRFSERIDSNRLFDPAPLLTRVLINGCRDGTAIQAYFVVGLTRNGSTYCLKIGLSYRIVSENQTLQFLKLPRYQFEVICLYLAPQSAL